MSNRKIADIKYIEMESGGTAIYIDPSVLPYFKELVRRGAQYWERAPIEIHEFASKFASGLDESGMNFRESCVYKTASELNNGTSQTEGRAKF